MVGSRDTNWAWGNSAVTDILLLSAVWAVGAFFADRNALALGGILNQQGVGNSTCQINQQEDPHGVCLLLNCTSNCKTGK